VRDAVCPSRKRGALYAGNEVNGAPTTRAQGRCAAPPGARPQTARSICAVPAAGRSAR
jgi:hypothetical protein